MEPLPQIPKLNLPSCPDTSPILKDEFNQFLGHNVFPKPIAENLQTFKSKFSELKTCGETVFSIYKEMQLDANEITHAETKIMESQAKYLVEEHKDVMRFRQLFPNIDPYIVKKYCLIQNEDIIPHITERILNNKMMPDEFLFKYPCKKTEERSTVENFKCSNLTDQQKINLEKSGVQKKICVKKTVFKKKMKDSPVLIAEPKEIVFKNFELNVIYETQIVIRNVSAKSQRIRAPFLRNSSKFYIKKYSLKSPIAPGMTSTFRIGFQSEYYSKFTDELVFGIVDSDEFIVKLKSFRQTPLLKGLVYTDEDLTECNFYSQTFTDDVCNFTFDCGSVLRGQTMQSTVILQNCGIVARYFIMSEFDWISNNVTSVTEDYTLVLPECTISPVYLKLEKDEVAEITIDFHPVSEGLCLEKVYLVSDNNSVQEIDIIGDSLMYKTCAFKAKMPDCPFPPLRTEDEVQNTLHMGAIYYNQKITASFSIYNISTLKYPFEWKKDKPPKNKQFRVIQNEWIQISPEAGTLLPVSEMDFHVTVHMKSKREGLYKHVLSIYAVDIPEQSLCEGNTYTFNEEYRSKDLTQPLLTLLIHEVEVVIHHIPISIRIYPEEIILPLIKRKEDRGKTSVRVVNEGFCTLCMAWIRKVKNSPHVNISIEPDTFEIKPNDSEVCQIVIDTDSYDDIEEIFTLSINEGFAERNLQIKAQVEKPQIRVSQSFFEFGIIKRGSHVVANLFVQNMSASVLYWEVAEFQYDFINHDFVESDCCSLSCNCGELCHRQSYCDIEYKIDTIVPRKFFSILVFYTIYKNIKQESSHVLILAEIHEPNIIILNEHGGDCIFRIEEEFYINESEARTIQLYNNSLVDAQFSWGTPSGAEIDFVFEHEIGMVHPNSRINVNFVMFFKKVGIIYSMLLPIWIEGKVDVTFLQIQCKIKPPQVVFRIPEAKDFVEVIWPYEFGTIGDFSSYSDLEDEATEVHKLKNLKEFDRHCTIINIMNYTEPDKCEKWFPDDVLEYLKGLESAAETICRFPSEKDLVSKASSKPLHSVFASATSMCEYVMEFYDVKCRKVYTQDIYITNNMQTPLDFSLSLKNFTAKEFQRKKIDNILIDLKWKPEDKFSKQLTAHGIVITVEPTCGRLHAKSTNIIKISVYAETWGHYLEELKIDVEDLPSFYINLVIKVISSPIEYPILGKHLPENCELFIRFGNVLKCAEEKKRTIYIKNISTIPHKITWHCLIKDVEEIEDPFNVLFDIFGYDLPCEEIKCKMKLMKYFGKESCKEFSLFRVEPNELYLNPEETKQIFVYLNPIKYEHYFSKSNIEAVVIGNLHVENKYSRQTNLFSRNAEKDTRPLRISLHANLELPAFDFKHIRGSTEATIDVNNILNREKVKLYFRIVFKNTSKVNLTVEMQIDEPFKIISMKSLATAGKIDLKNVNKALVASDACMELFLCCQPSYYFVKQIAHSIYSKSFCNLGADYDYEVKTTNQVRVVRNLEIHHDCQITQRIPINLTMFFPIIEISTEYVDFGQVCLNSCKSMSLKLLNKTASPTHFEVIFESTNGIFRAEPTSGLLPPSTAHDHSLYLTISFTPKDVIEFRENLIIITKLPQCEYNVELVGYGTMDEKYFKELCLLKV